MTRAWHTIDRVDTDEGALELRQRGPRDFLITVGGRVLMTSAAHRSEDALARLACAGVKGRRAPRLLVGGLGMGYTLRATLDAVPGDARVTVAELNPAVAAWCRGPLAVLAASPLDDPRVKLVLGDVARVIAAAASGARERFDAIALDLYEGPPPSRIADGDALYGARAIAAARAALTAGGTYCVWSETPSPAFERALRASGFTVDTHRLGGRGASVHVVYVARRAG